MSGTGERQDAGSGEQRWPGKRTNGATAGARRVLVADDNTDAAETLSLLLSLLGNEVRTAADGVEALAVAEEFRPDVVFLDIGMPRMNGHAVARRIRGEHWGKTTILIALSGWGQEEDRRRSADAGIDLHLTKPLDPARLDELLNKLCPRK